MTSHCWLVKQEPESYSWADFARDRKTVWDGVRNYAARNHLKSMKRGDRVLFYASGGPKAVIGLATVSREAFPDPSADEPGWVAVELRAGRPLARPVDLEEIKRTPALAALPLLRQSRLSVMPVGEKEYAAILALAEKEAPGA